MLIVIRFFMPYSAIALTHVMAISVSLRGLSRVPSVQKYILVYQAGVVLDLTSPPVASILLHDGYNKSQVSRSLGL